MEKELAASSYPGYSTSTAPATGYSGSYSAPVPPPQGSFVAQPYSYSSSGYGNYPSATNGYTSTGAMNGYGAPSYGAANGASSMPSNYASSGYGSTYGASRAPPPISMGQSASYSALPTTGSFIAEPAYTPPSQSYTPPPNNYGQTGSYVPPPSMNGAGPLGTSAYAPPLGTSTYMPPGTSPYMPSGMSGPYSGLSGGMGGYTSQSPYGGYGSYPPPYGTSSVPPPYAMPSFGGLGGGVPSAGSFIASPFEGPSGASSVPYGLGQPSSLYPDPLKSAGGESFVASPMDMKRATSPLDPGPPKSPQSGAPKKMPRPTSTARPKLRDARTPPAKHRPRGGCCGGC